MDDEILERTYRRFFPLIRQKCGRMLVDAQEAEDVAQETGEIRPTGATQLPVSWRLDEASSAEVIDILLGDHPLDLSELASAPENSWKSRLTLPRKSAL